MILEEPFDWPVFQGMECNNRYPATWLQGPDSTLQSGLYPVQFAVDLNPESLECLGRRMDPSMPVLIRNRVPDDVSKFIREFYLLALPVRADSGGNPSGIPLLTVVEDQVRKALLIVGVDHLRRIKIPVDVQPHVKLLLTLEAEAPA